MSPEHQEIQEYNIYRIVPLANDVKDPKCFSLQAVFEIIEVKANYLKQAFTIPDGCRWAEFPKKLVGIIQQHFLLPNRSIVYVPGIITPIIIQKNKTV